MSIGVIETPAAAFRRRHPHASVETIESAMRHAAQTYDEGSASWFALVDDSLSEEVPS